MKLPQFPALKAALERFSAWWATLAPREQRLLAVGGAVVALAVLHAAVWQPAVRARRALHSDLAAARALAGTLEVLAAELQRNRGAGTVTGAGQSLLAVVDQSRRASSLTKPPSRLQPEGESTVRIWMEDVPFDALLRWLADLQLRHGVRVETADIERESAPGLVNARLTLVR
jgi:general secretion pathway protein M